MTLFNKMIKGIVIDPNFTIYVDLARCISPGKRIHLLKMVDPLIPHYFKFHIPKEEKKFININLSIAETIGHCQSVNAFLTRVVKPLENEK